MRYTVVTEEDLQAARPGLELLERLSEDDFKVMLYGVTNKKLVLMSAEEELERDIDEEAGEKAPSLNEVAIAIPLSSDVLYRLTGSGFTMKREEFCYRAGRDNIRTNWFYDRMGIPVTLGDFTTLALSTDDTWLDDFLGEHGVNTGAVEADITVPRDPVPAVQAPEPAATPEPVTASKRASVTEPKKVPAAVFTGNNSIDNFLS